MVIRELALANYALTQMLQVIDIISCLLNLLMLLIKGCSKT